MSSSVRGTLSSAKLALAVKRLRAQTEAIDLLDSEPLAIVGMGCRFPGGADTPEKYWQLLIDGTDAIREVPDGRWNNTASMPAGMRRGGFLAQVDTFDAEFFGIPAREAVYVDPQHRLLVEVTWEALWDAGIPPEALSGNKAGIFASVPGYDYARMILEESASAATYSSSNGAQCMAAGRIAYLLDARGPTVLVDTACSSALVATDQACRSLRSRDADIAIVGASRLKLLPDETIYAARWGLLAADGRCKTFDRDADGYAAGEGCGVIVLKRLADALANRDRIHAVLRGTAVNHDGRSTVMTAPNGPAQESVMRAALKNAVIESAEVGFIEVHGTGTALGDAIEVEALRSVYDGNDANGMPCFLGAGKTNIGHLEAASGMAAIIKTVLCLKNEAIPANRNLEHLSPRISLDSSRFELVTELKEWKHTMQPRFAAVHSFGISGTNAHVVLEEPPVIPQAASGKNDSYLLLLSAKSKNAIRELAESYAEYLLLNESSPASPTLKDICATAARHRSHYPFRLALIAESAQTMRARLTSFLQGKVQTEVFEGFIESGKNSGQAKETQSLREAAQHYVSAYDFNAEKVFARPDVLATLPSYPWQRRRFWIEQTTRGNIFSQTATDTSSRKLLSQLKAADLEQRHKLLKDGVKSSLRKVMELDASYIFDENQPLQELGLDSLMAVDLRNVLQSALQCEIRPTIIFEHPTISTFADYLDTLFWAGHDPAEPSSVEEEIRL